MKQKQKQFMNKIIFMVKYRITKIGRVGNNDSYFGDTQEYFEGYAYEKPTINERFILFNKTRNVVINTSPIMEITDKLLYTMYSVYEYEIID